MNDEYARLLRAVRALDLYDREALASVTNDSIRAVLTARGWRFMANVPWYGDLAVNAFETWENPSLEEPHTHLPIDVSLPLEHHKSWRRDRGRYVRECLVNAAKWHVESPAVILAECLAEQEKS